MSTSHATEVPVTAIWEGDTVYWFDDMQQPTAHKVVEGIEEVDAS